MLGTLTDLLLKCPYNFENCPLIRTQSVILVELSALHAHLISVSVGVTSQRKVKKTHSVIWAFYSLYLGCIKIATPTQRVIHMDTVYRLNKTKQNTI